MRLAPRILVASALLLALGIGCGSAGGGGACAGLQPLPSDPKPLGFPSDQMIEGGMQARITAHGMQTLSSAIPKIASGALGNGFCAVEDQTLFDIGIQSASMCNQPSPTCSGNTGCSAYVFLDSAQRPASHDTGDAMPPPPASPPREDGKDKIVVTVNDSLTNPSLTIDMWLDVLVPVKFSASGLVSGSCYMYAYSNHVDDDNAEPVHVQATVALGTDPTTGQLTINLTNLAIPNLGITLSGTSGVCSFLSDVGNGVLDIFNSIPDLIKNFIINALRGPINSFLQSLLPNPPGLAGVFNPAQLLSQFSPPDDAHLEMYIVPGGYVQTSGGGLTLGIESGMNSDRDESTRAPGLASEPSLCVPARPTPDLSGQPWNLPFNASRKDFLLSPANEFSGMPDPTDMNGMMKDVAIGVSRTFLDLAGFHIYNSGTMCLAIGGDTIPQLNAGTLSVVVGSLSNILEDNKAPLALVLRPQTPLQFTLGAGDMTDALLHIAVSDLRIDFYAWIEERYVRIFTLGVDLNIGINLTVTQDANGNPAIQPMLMGVDSQHITIRVSNTDLLQEDPSDLEKVFPALINIATGALGGVIKPIPLPSVAGFSLNNLEVQRVQTSQDDFLGIFADIVNSSPAPLIDWSDPLHPKRAGALETHAQVAEIAVPSESSLQAMVKAGPPFADSAMPRVTLKLDADGANNQPVEYGWRIDGGMWHTWSRDPNPTIADDAFLLQGRHVIEVRSRVVNQWSTEDMSPAKLTVLIDSVPPEIHAALDDKNPQLIDFNGVDIVSDAKALTYAWLDENGQQTPFTSQSSMTMADAERITDGGKKPLVLFAKDEAGNVARAEVSLDDLNGFHGRTTNPPSSGCGCSLGGADRGTGPLAGALFILGLLVLLRRRKAQLLALIAIGALGMWAAGCGCEDTGRQCSINDDCIKMQCPAGQIPQCISQMCMCGPDLPEGRIGRFSSMTLIGPDAYVSAYNTDYGDLMIGHVTPPGVITDWDFVDGMPEEAPDTPGSHVRGGQSESEPGDDVGRYTSIATTQSQEPVIAYYDKTHGALKFASFGVIRWHSHVVDQGTGSPDSGGDDIGRWASLTIGPDGRPAIAYTATVQMGMSGMPEGQLRWAQANVPDPQQQSDWTVTVVDARPLPANMSMPDGGVPDGGAAPSMGEPLLPEGIGLMASAARKSDGTPGIAYYDRTRGNLRYVEYNPSASAWANPMILDGEDAMGNDTADVGMYPSLVYDQNDVGHISYVDATHDNLLYVNTMDKTPEVVDDGYRPDDEMTQDGLNSPVYHLVGDSSSIQMAGSQPVIAYQDSTVEQLRLAVRGTDGKWMLQTVAGHATPFAGSYGFYADLKVAQTHGIISSYAINQHLDTPIFYVEVFAVDLGLIM